MIEALRAYLEQAELKYEQDYTDWLTVKLACHHPLEKRRLLTGWLFGEPYPDVISELVGAKSVSLIRDRVVSKAKDKALEALVISPLEEQLDAAINWLGCKVFLSEKGEGEVEERWGHLQNVYYHGEGLTMVEGIKNWFVYESKPYQDGYYVKVVRPTRYNAGQYYEKNEGFVAKGVESNYFHEEYKKAFFLKNRREKAKMLRQMGL